MKFNIFFKIFLLLTGIFVTADYCQTTVTIDTTKKYQTISGWGGGLRRGTKAFYSAPQTIISQVEDLCFNKLHINIIRALCQANMEPVNDNSDPFNLDTSKFVWIYYDSTTKDIYAIKRAQTVSNGRINYIFSSNNSAPPWQKTNHNITYGGRILPNMYDEFTEYESAYLLGMQNRYHIRINGFSLFNEPGDSVYFETLSSPPSQVRDLVKLMRSRLDVLEKSGALPHIDIIAPEAASVSSTKNPPGVGNSTIFYMDPAQGGINSDTAAINSVAIVGTHDYLDEDNSADWTKLKSMSDNKPIWVTEVSSGSSVAYDITSKNAVVQAKWIHRSFTLADVKAFCMYALYDTLPRNGTNNGSLIYYDPNTVTIPKRYYGFKQFVNFVHPGYIRINASSSSSNLYVSAYISMPGDTLVIVAINDLGSSISNIKFNCPASNNSVLQYATCDNPDYSTTRLTDISPPANGNFTSDMPATSIKTFIIPIKKATFISKNDLLPDKYELQQNYPNPFNPSTTIKYSLPVSGDVTIKIYDILGREIASLVNDIKAAGNYEVVFNAENFPSGLYFYKIQSGNFTQTRKMILLK